jgi:tRNA-dihydrouridine synthase
VLCLPCQPDKPIYAVMAPMVAASDYAFRCLIRQYGILKDGSTLNKYLSNNSNHHDGILTFTQMLHAKNLLEDDTFFTNHFDIYEYSTKCRVHAEDLTKSQKNIYKTTADYTNSQAPVPHAIFGPVIAQLAGNDAATVVAAARRIIHGTQEQIAGIDINLGCPQNIAKKGNYGAFLMEEAPEKVYGMLKALRQSIPDTVSVSAKIRLPLDPKRQTAVIQHLCDTGINFLTIHGRDYTENKTTIKQIQLPRLIEAVQTARDYGGLPIIVNGGIEYLEDAIRLQSITGAAAVMSSEAILERPSLLSQINASLVKGKALDILSPNVLEMTPKERFLEQIQSSRDYIQWCYYAPPLRGVLGTHGGSFNVVRSHLFKMLYRYLNDERNIDLRDSLANGYSMQRLDQASALIDSLCSRYEHFTDVEWETLSSSQYPDSSWYRRHRRALLSGSFIHQKHKKTYTPSLSEEQEPAASSDEAVLSPSDAIDERKLSIRRKIEKLKNQKRVTNFL